MGLDAFSCQIKSSSQSPLLSQCQGLQIYQGIAMVLLCWGNLGRTGGTGSKGWRAVDQKLLQGFKQLLSLFLQVLPAGKEEAQLWDPQRAKLLVPRDICDLGDPAAASILRHLWERLQGAALSPAPLSCL